MITRNCIVIYQDAPLITNLFNTPLHPNLVVLSTASLLVRAGGGAVGARGGQSVGSGGVEDEVVQRIVSLIDDWYVSLVAGYGVALVVSPQASAAEVRAGTRVFKIPTPLPMRIFARGV